MKSYKIEYLPLAKNDLLEIVDYISHNLKNPKAANRLAEEIIGEIKGLSAFPYSAPIYIPIRLLEHEYRKLLVKNYMVFYWVEERTKVITIARIFYAKRNFDSSLI